MSKQSFNAVRGMNDILPTETPAWQFLEQCAADVFAAYGYQEIRLPMVEPTELFARSIGDVTDIVEKEMYTFLDRNDQSLSLRPEGTASCVRACLQHGLLHNQTQRLWYSGPMFRYERPQKGRQRQFHQIGVEAFGLAGPDIDAELLAMSRRLWQELGIDQQVRLEINSLGSLEARATYRRELQAFLRDHMGALDEDSLRRLDSNPLRILDSKNPETQAVLQAAPRLQDWLDQESTEHFAQLCAQLDALGIEYVRNPRLVRGLDYYSKTVFEWVTDSLGAQGTVCAGGRYDGLVEQLGGKPTAGIGFAMGMERLCLMLEETAGHGSTGAVDAYFIVGGDAQQQEALQWCEQLRSRLPTLRLLMHCGGGSMKSQMKKADKSGAAWALLFGEQEQADGTLTVKNLRDPAITQQALPGERVAEYLLPYLGM